MSAVIAAAVIFLLVRVMFKNKDKEREEYRKEREKQTFFEYPEGGYGLDDDPVLDELFFLDIMEGDK